MSVSEKSVSLKAHQSLEEVEHRTSVKYANGFDVFLLGITIVIGGQVFSWNVSLLAGFWEAFLGMIATGIGYICLVCCIAEMASALPFSGGSYGFARVCLGPFFGFLVGCCETMQNIAYVASAAIPLAEMFAIVFETEAETEPWYFALFFGTAVAINVIGGHTFWWFSRLIGVISLLIILLYIAATASNGDFNRYSGGYLTNYRFDATSFMTYLPICAWYFIGVESLPLACVDCQQPSQQLPFGMVLCVVVLVCTAIGVFFTAASQSPGTEAVGGAVLPLNYGFQRSFGWTEAEVTWLALPASYATGFGFIFIYGRQMCSMARSGLLPKFLSPRTKDTNSPYAALVVGSALAIFGALVVYYTDVTYLNQVFFLCLLASYTTNIAVFLCFFIFRQRYSSMTRPFISPLGYGGAIYGIAFYAVGIVSVLGFQTDQIPLIILSIYLALLIVYYYCYGYQTQKLSEEEQKVLFKAYVINANAIKRKLKKGGGGASSVVGSVHGTEYPDNGSVVGEGRKQGKHRPSSTIIEDSHSREVVQSRPFEAEEERPIDHCVREKEVVDFQLSNDDEEEEEDDEENNPIKESTLSPAEFTAPSSYPYPQAISRSNRVQPEPITGQRDLPASERQSSSRHMNPNHSNPNHQNHHPSHNHSSQRGRDFFLLRSSITHSLSEKFKEIVQDFKLVSFMSEDERQSYEAIVLADMCGKLEPEAIEAENEEQKEEMKAVKRGRGLFGSNKVQSEPGPGGREDRDIEMGERGGSVNRSHHNEIEEVI